MHAAGRADINFVELRENNAQERETILVEWHVIKVQFGH